MDPATTGHTIVRISGRIGGTIRVGDIGGIIGGILGVQRIVGRIAVKTRVGDIASIQILVLLAFGQLLVYNVLTQIISWTRSATTKGLKLMLNNEPPDNAVGYSTSDTAAVTVPVAVHKDRTCEEFIHGWTKKVRIVAGCRCAVNIVIADSNIFATVSKASVSVVLNERFWKGEVASRTRDSELGLASIFELFIKFGFH
jgi:hypothetical protein